MKFGTVPVLIDKSLRYELICQSAANRLRCCRDYRWIAGNSTSKDIALLSVKRNYS